MKKYYPLSQIEQRSSILQLSTSRTWCNIRDRESPFKQLKFNTRVMTTWAINGGRLNVTMSNSALKSVLPAFRSTTRSPLLLCENQLIENSLLTFSKTGKNGSNNKKLLKGFLKSKIKISLIKQNKKVPISPSKMHPRQTRSVSEVS